MAWGKSLKEAYWIEGIGRLRGYPAASLPDQSRERRRPKKVIASPHSPPVRHRPKADGPPVLTDEERAESYRLAEQMERARGDWNQFWEKRARTVRRELGRSGPPTRSDVFYVRALEAGEDAYGQPFSAKVFLRTRTGFRYERRVGLNDFVTQDEAALLLRLSVMGVNKWVRSKSLPARKLKGVVVLRLRDVLAVARARGKPVPMTLAPGYVMTSDMVKRMKQLGPAAGLGLQADKAAHRRGE